MEKTGLTIKIVSGVTRFKRPHPSTKEIVDRIHVHYTDGTTKDFDPIEWDMLVSEGKKLWMEHESEINKVKESLDD